jgi:hypothetical protein
MAQPHISIWLDGSGRRHYAPREKLVGGYRIEQVERDNLRAVEISVLWHTDGKGDEDLAVHDFRRRSLNKGDWINPGQPDIFETILPATPLSYSGIILKIIWCVRVRIFLKGGREFVEELPFILGDVPDVRKCRKEG